MSKYRNNKQQIADAATLRAYDNGVVNRNPDVVYVEALQKDFNWIEGSSAVDDGIHIIAQAAQTTGRWIDTKLKKLTGTGTSTILDNSQSELVSCTVTGLNVGDNISVSITNSNTAYAGAAIPAGVRIAVVNTVVATDTVQVEVINETGTDGIKGMTLNLSVIVF